MMDVNNPLANRQAQPRAFGPMGTRFVCAIKTIKYSCVILWSNPNPVISDHDLCLISRKA
jgi:hypothetical protein